MKLLLLSLLVVCLLICSDGKKGNGKGKGNKRGKGNGNWNTNGNGHGDENVNVSEEEDDEDEDDEEEDDEDDEDDETEMGKGRGKGHGKGRGKGHGKGRGKGHGKGRGKGHGKGRGKGYGKGRGKGFCRKIVKAYDNWNEAYANQDVNALVCLYTKNAVIIPPNHEPVVGRDAISEYFTDLFAAGAPPTEFSVCGVVERCGKGQVIRSTGNQTEADGSDTKLSGVRVMKKRKGGARIKLEIWNSNNGTSPDLSMRL